MTQRRPIIYRTLLVTLGLLVGLAVVMGGNMTYTAWQNQRARAALEADFAAQHAQWQSQNLQNYQIQHSICQGEVCCRDVQLHVIDGSLVNAEHTCSASQIPRAWYLGRQHFYEMDGLYSWFTNWLHFNDKRMVEIEYDPRQHYIRRLVFRTTLSEDPITVWYDNLQPQAQ